MFVENRAESVEIFKDLDQALHWLADDDDQIQVFRDLLARRQGR